MASTISAGTTTTTALVYSADTSGVLQLQTNGGTTAITIDTNQNATFAGKVASASSLQLATNGTTTAITIDTAQNVGVGTTPSAWGSGRPAIEMNSSVSAYIVNNNTGALQLQNNSYYNGSVNVAKVTGAGSAYSQYQGTHNWYSMASVSAGATQTFSQNMTLDASGNLLVGATSVSGSNERFNVTGANAGSVARFNNTNATPYGVYSLYTSTPNNTASQFFYSADGTAARFYVASNGGIYNFSANNSNLSDRREKTNFAPAGDYLAKICAIPVQTFNYIDQNLEKDDGLTLGVVAQDVQAVAPELVTESNWAKADDEPKMRLSIYQTDLQYALMKCIQELSAQVTTLQTQVTALKG